MVSQLALAHETGQLTPGSHVRHGFPPFPAPPQPVAKEFSFFSSGVFGSEGFAIFGIGSGSRQPVHGPLRKKKNVKVVS